MKPSHLGRIQRVLPLVFRDDKQSLNRPNHSQVQIWGNMTKKVTTDELKALFSGKDEFSLVDVREEGEFSKGHLLMACCIPLSRIELLIDDLIPESDTPIVLMDNGPSDTYQRARRAADRLSAFGYTNPCILEGGITGWQKAGHTLFSGVNVISKAFGEFVETVYGTPHIAPETLYEKIKKKEKLIIFDSRPEEEYHRMNIPGALNVPGSELVYRFFDMVPDPDTLVVVNCAGRTRSIIGAQSLINARVPNPVAALKNGTMGWHLANLNLDHGHRLDLPSPSAEGFAMATDCARRVAERFNVKKIDRNTLAQWQKEGAGRTLYLLDVRLPGEFEAGHLKGSRNAPGVQLVQATDEYMAVRNARVVLVDDTEIRAIMTASWLIQSGWRDVSVLAGGLGDEPLAQGPHAPHIPGLIKMKTVSVQQLKEQLETPGEVALLDIATSREYIRSHIPGAHWIIRSRLAQDISRIPTSKKYVITSPDDVMAHLSAQELQALRGGTPVSVLKGGTAAWKKAGYAAEKSMTAPASAVEDVWLKPYEYESKNGPETAMREYLDWEVALTEAVEKDGSIIFSRFD